MTAATTKKMAVAMAFVLMMIGWVVSYYGPVASATADVVEVVGQTENSTTYQLDENTTMTAFDDGTKIMVEEGEWIDDEIGASELITIS